MTTDSPTTVTTLLERMLSAGLSEERARAWIAAGAVKVNGHRVMDPDAVLPAGARWIIHP